MLSYMSNKKLSNVEFRRMTGVKRETFNYLLKRLRSVTPKRKSGPKKTLSLQKQLLLTLDYWRDYNSLLKTGKKYNVSESTACRIYRDVELRLAEAGICKLPGKKYLLTGFEESFTIDATECPIERPKRKPKRRIKNKQKHFYSGKKKRHTIKAQLVIHGRQITSTAFANGRMHDYKLFKKSKTKLHPKKNVKVDSGYQGLQKIHANTDLPKKNKKKDPLTKQDKLKNKEQAKKRVVVEHVIGHLKKFKIISQKYRNRRKRFTLKFNLICGIYNYENRG